MEDTSDITWLGHASFYITDKTTPQAVYYIDPFDLHQPTLPKASVIFITHAHYDHLSQSDIMKIIDDDTVVVAPPDCLSQLTLPEKQKFPVGPNNAYRIKDLSFQTVPAYNIHPDRLSFHPKINYWVGYILTINGKRFYHPGDSDYIPEMNDLTKEHLDVAFLPIGGTYTMDVNQAIQAANAIGANLTIPMHYKRLLGEHAKEVEEKFIAGVTNSKVVTLTELA